jgi:hypothetical protein
MTKNVKDQKWRETRQSKYDKTVKTTTLIQAQRYKVVEKWEYHFRNEIRRNDKLKTFCDSRKPPTPQRSVTENEILAALMTVPVAPVELIDGVGIGVVAVDGISTDLLFFAGV